VYDIQPTNPTGGVFLQSAITIEKHQQVAVAAKE